MGDMADEAANRAMQQWGELDPPLWKMTNQEWETRTGKTSPRGTYPEASPQLTAYSSFTKEDICAIFDVPISIITNQQKETTMTSIKENLQAQIDRASARLKNLERFPEAEDYPVGTLIGFDRRFAGLGPKVFNYAGVKTDVGWFITGRKAATAMTWGALMAWLAEDGETLNLVVCSEVTELIAPIEAPEAYGDEGE